MRHSKKAAKYLTPQVRSIPLDELIKRLEGAPPRPDILTMLQKAREIQETKRT